MIEVDEIPGSVVAMTWAKFQDASSHVRMYGLLVSYIVCVISYVLYVLLNAGVHFFSVDSCIVDDIS